MPLCREDVAFSAGRDRLLGVQLSLLFVAKLKYLSSLCHSNVGRIVPNVLFSFVGAQLGPTQLDLCFPAAWPRALQTACGWCSGEPFGSAHLLGFKLCLCIDLWQLIGSSPPLRVRLPLARRRRAGLFFRFFPRPVTYLHSESHFRRGHDHHLGRSPSRTRR